MPPSSSGKKGHSQGIACEICNLAQYVIFLCQRHSKQELQHADATHGAALFGTKCNARTENEACKNRQQEEYLCITLNIVTDCCKNCVCPVCCALTWELQTDTTRFHQNPFVHPVCTVNTFLHQLRHTKGVMQQTRWRFL